MIEFGESEPRWAEDKQANLKGTQREKQIEVTKVQRRQHLHIQLKSK